MDARAVRRGRRATGVAGPYRSILGSKEDPRNRELYWRQYDLWNETGWAHESESSESGGVQAVGL